MTNVKLVEKQLNIFLIFYYLNRLWLFVTKYSKCLKSVITTTCFWVHRRLNIDYQSLEQIDRKDPSGTF